MDKNTFRHLSPEELEALADQLHQLAMDLLRYAEERLQEPRSRLRIIHCDAGQELMQKTGLKIE